MGKKAVEVSVDQIVAIAEMLDICPERLTAAFDEHGISHEDIEFEEAPEIRSVSIKDLSRVFTPPEFENRGFWKNLVNPYN